MIKRGARAATGDVTVFMDADGQHAPELIQRLDRPGEGSDMVVGARGVDGKPVSTGAWLTGSTTGFCQSHDRFDVKRPTSGFRPCDRTSSRSFCTCCPM